jgi:formate dehydrogenase subunit delta
MSADKLVYMANQIGKFFAHKPSDVAVAAIVDHLLKFWDPRMRAEICRSLDSIGDHMLPNVRRAVENLRDG